MEVVGISFAALGTADLCIKFALVSISYRSDLLLCEFCESVMIDPRSLSLDMANILSPDVARISMPTGNYES